MTYYCFGDSIPDGTGASVEANKWRNVLASQLSVSITNLAHGGDMVGDQTNEVYSVATGAGGVSLIQLGVNDQRVYGESATKQAYFRDGLRNHIAWLALASKQTARSVGGETGSWANTGILGIGRSSTAVNSTKTFTVSGTSVYVGLIIVDTAGAAGTYEIRVDGTLMGSYSANAPGVSTTLQGSPYPYNERLHRFAGLSNGAHTVQVKMTGPSNLYVQWAAGNAQSVFPRVFVGNIIRPNGYQWGGSLANIQAYNADTAQTVADLRADGLDVTLVDLYSAIDPATDLHADNLHPNDAGHAKIAAAFRSAIVWENLEHQFSPVTVLKRDDGLFFIDNGETLIQLVTQ